jgi:hypothetical protein
VKVMAPTAVFVALALALALDVGQTEVTTSS